MYTKLFGLKTIILRYFNVYGNRHPLRGQYAPVVGIFLRQKNNGEPLTIVGDGEQRRDFTNVLDVVDANIRSATIDVESNFYGNVYNVGTGINHSINQVANLISDNQIHISERIGESRITLANNNKIKEVFGWTPNIKLEDWISQQ
jgi:UDP-glucose 4-epimerase